MKPKMKIKLGIDFLMTVLLLFQMAYQITGQELHEWLGAGMLTLFLAHNVLNIRWYGTLLKGKCTLPRILQAVINFAVLIAILCLGYSGIVMSRHVFAAFPIRGPMATARNMHLVASYWGFVLMGVHLGFHWSMILGMFRRLCIGGKQAAGKKASVLIVWLIRLMAVSIAGYGAYSFHKANIISYMFLKNQFVFFDFEQKAVSVFAEYMVMMGFWAFVGYYVMKGIRNESKGFGKKI